MLFAVNIEAAEVVWTGYKATGRMSAHVNGIEAGDRVFVAAFNANDELVRAASAVSEGESVDVPINFVNTSYTKTFIWDKDSLAPVNTVTSTLTAEGIKDDAIFSDNQQANRIDEVVGYRTFDAVSGDYMIKMDVTLWKKGDNAIALGDSDNGVLSYGTSSAILLFNGDNFSFRDGAGNGSYAAGAVDLCPAELNKTYEIVFWGNTETDTYKIVITDGTKRYTSQVIHSRTNAEKLDTIALISNGKNTTVINESYSDFAFLGKNLEIITDSDDMVLEPVYVYEGFEGLYYGMKVDGKYVRGNNGKLTYDYNTVADASAMFIPLL